MSSNVARKATIQAKERKDDLMILSFSISGLLHADY